MKHDLANSARDYMALGLSVIALTGKAPNGAIHLHGLHDAFGPDRLDEVGVVVHAFSHERTTGVGILTSAPLVVIDIDGEEGAEQWKGMVGEDYLDASWAAKTGRGLHLYYTSTLPTGTVKLGPKLDLKGEGGYVAAPPSIHPDGHRYEWLRSPGAALLEVPDPVHDLLKARAAWDRRKERGKEISILSGALKDKTPLIEGMAGAQEGNRNAYLYWATCTMLEESASTEDLERLRDVAIAAGLTRQEVVRTMRSARD